MADVCWSVSALWDATIAALITSLMGECDVFVSIVSLLGWFCKVCVAGGLQSPPSMVVIAADQDF